MSMKDVCDKFGRNYWFWYGQIKKGNLKFIQVADGGKLLVDEMDVENWFKKQKKTIAQY